MTLIMSGIEQVLHKCYPLLDLLCTDYVPRLGQKLYNASSHLTLRTTCEVGPITPFQMRALRLQEAK